MRKPPVTTVPKKTRNSALKRTPKSPPDRGMLLLLQSIANDEKQPGSVRTAAARSVMEATGQIGKHQAAPDQDGGTAPLEGMTRKELEQELFRLRAAHAASAQVETQQQQPHGRELFSLT